MHRTNRFLVSLLLASLVLSCTPRQHNSGDLMIVQRGMPLTLVPYQRSEIFTNSAQANLFEALVGFDRDMAIQPLLAERWENPDDRTWVFVIRQGVRFHNGNAMTADDVVYSLNTARSMPGSALRSYFATVDSIVRLSDQAVKIITRKPDPILLNRLVLAFIVPDGSLEKGRIDDFAKNPAGTGPYRIESPPTERQLALKYWEQYWGSKPGIRRMIIREAPDIDAVIRQLQAGAADLAPQLTPEMAVRIGREGGGLITIARRPGLGLRFLGMNVRQKPFNDLRVRQAISCALDRGKLVEALLLGYGAPVNQLVPQGVFGFNPGLPALVYNPEQAVALLARAGYPRGVDVTLVLSSRRVKEGEEIRRQLAAAGIRVSLSVLAREQFFAALDTSSFYLVAEISTTGDASELFNDAIHSRTAGFGGLNRSRYGNPAVDRMIESSLDDIDQMRRLKILQQIMALTMQDLPLLPLYVEDDIYGVSRRISWQPRMDMMVLGKDISLAQRRGQAQ